MGLNTNTVIIGAGPYGLSLAAHLAAAGVDYRIFGQPMQFWKAHVPPGMLLKSLGSSANLFGPAAGFTVADHYAEQHLAYSEQTPIPVGVFIDYADAFQRHFVPDCDQRNVVSVARNGDAFAIQLDDGKYLRAARVVVAVGIRRFNYIPPVLAALPAELVTHSVDYGAVDGLRGRKVAVLGSGASAIDLAVALQDRAVDVTVISRRPRLAFQSPPGTRRFYHRLRSPDSPIGGGWNLWFYANAPQLFHLLPEELRARRVATSLGPSSGWFMADRVRGRIPIVSGHQVAQADILGGRVRLRIVSVDGRESDFTADHVIAATGFSVDVGRLDLLSPSLTNEIATARGAPLLSRNFESSARGLYFIGAATAPSFGPVMRFVAGAGYTVRRVSAALARSGMRPQTAMVPLAAGN